ncbi:Phosphoinositide-specific phospholipase C [Trypanosoma melophagium]|uniref:Phosphoinositide-specific phospholipase C n=1 Tax=Trypanosoma melophagium TaxID=715481 RepID=UPI00351A7F5F|nr:Phosphoinositide-specific phospholipase C [Trypanosoma melophagium]
MGICQAKESLRKENHNHSKECHGEKKINSKSDEKSPAHSPRNFDQQVAAEQFLRSFLEGAEITFSTFSFRSPEEKYNVSLTFMNSCVEVTRNKFRLKTEVVLNTITRIANELKLEAILKALPGVTEYCVDDGFARLLNAWFNNNTGFAKNADGTTERMVTNAKGQNNGMTTTNDFSSILNSYLCSATLVHSMNLFEKYAGDGDKMTVEQFGKFLREEQRNEVTDIQVVEKCKYRFGGVVHRFNFSTYTGSLLTNNALDPTRTTDVWQDMTQPLTRYLISTAQIETEDDLKRALSDNSRVFVLKVRKDENGVLYSGKCPLQSILEGIRTSGFLNIPYPIILSLSPTDKIPVEVKDELAKKLTESLGAMLAKGLMFEGAIISDPKFSPAAQRKKVLIAGHQCSLKPFLGCLVADMNKEGLGVRVTDVLPGTPASKAGLCKDDWLTHINGSPILSKKNLREHLIKFHLGEEFTLRKENLNEVKVVVGGTVDKEDKKESVALSNILFLKYTTSEKPRPWEIQVFTEKSIRTAQLPRKDLDDHFAFFSSEGNTDNVNCIGIASKMGIQLIDYGNNWKGRVWAQGRFVDNGHSGYLIKSDSEEEGTVNTTVQIIAGPQEIQEPGLTKGEAHVYGAGSARVNGNNFTFEGCNEATVAVIDCEFSQKRASFVFTAAFPPALLRDGYRVLPLVQTAGPKETEVPTFGAYCYIRRNNR